MSRYIPLILTGVLLNAAAQLTLKQGMRQIGHFEFRFGSILNIGWNVITNPYIISGLSCYVVSVVVWLMVLSRVEVSYAYPLLSVGYIVTAVAGYYWFAEALSPSRWIGIITICVGVWFITRTG